MQFTLNSCLNFQNACGVANGPRHSAICHKISHLSTQVGLMPGWSVVAVPTGNQPETGIRFQQHLAKPLTSPAARPQAHHQQPSPQSYPLPSPVFTPVLVFVFTTQLTIPSPPPKPQPNQLQPHPLQLPDPTNATEPACFLEYTVGLQSQVERFMSSWAFVPPPFLLQPSKVNL